jgi:hypothetical protein
MSPESTTPIIDQSSTVTTAELRQTTSHWSTPQQEVFAYLPVRGYGFRYTLQRINVLRLDPLC